MQKPLTHILALTTFFLGITFVAHAQGSSYENPITYGGITDIPGLLLGLVKLVLLIGVPIIVLFVIYSGFLFVSAGDNEAEITKAKTVFQWTVVGALVLLGAEAISLAIQGTITSLGGPSPS